MASYIAYAQNPVKMKWNSGKDYTSGAMGWHSIPGMYAGGSVTFTRSSEQDTWVSYNGDITNTLSSESGSDGHYGNTEGSTTDHPIGVRVYAGNRLIQETIFTAPGYSKKTKTITIKGSFEMPNNDEAVSVIYYCTDSGWGNCTATNAPVGQTTVFSMAAGQLKYVPYKPPTVSISAYNGDNIARADGTSLDSQLQKVSITTSNSDGYTSTTRLTINGKAKDATYGNGTQTGEFYPANYSVGNQKSYTVTANTTHDKKADYTASSSITLYTYTSPTNPNVTIKDGKTTISPQDGSYLSYTIGSKGWNSSSLESDFTTTIKFPSTDAINIASIANNGNNGVRTESKTYSLNATNLNAKLTTAERSVSKATIKVVITATNPNAGWSISDDITFYVQYQPTLAPTGGDVKYGGISYKDATVIITKVPKVTASWSYDINKGASGVVNGYKYTVYADSSKKTVMKTGTTSGTSVDISTSEMNLGTMNYIVITPYYTKPDGKGDIDGAQSVGFNLVKPLNKLYKPVIEYPQKDYTLDDKSTTAYWHNKNFRVCFVSSQDPDIDKVTSTQNVTPETYEYNNIQVNINGTVYSYNEHSAMFSRNKTGHLHHFVINPSLISNFANATPASYYNIQVRFQKKYFANTNSEDSWSDWSDIVTITMHTLPTQTFTAGQEIKALHLDNIKKHIIHAYNAYSGTDASYADTPVGGIIAYETFKTYYDYIQAIKKTVNEYGAFTRNAVKFDTANATETIDAFKQEFITASNDVKYADDSTGSNYFKLLEESLKNLK